MTEQLLQAIAAGDAAFEAGDWEGAIRHFLVAHAAMPTDVNLGLVLANLYHQLGDAAARRAMLLETFRTGDRRASGVAHALGAALLEIGAAVEAAECFAQVVAALPNDPAALGALAAARRALGDPAGGWPLAKRAVTLAPREPALLLTAAQVRHELGDLLGALNWLDKAERARPNHAPTRVQRAYTTLLRGASREGWTHFESRPLPVPATDARAWQGEPLSGRSLLVTAEQGVGDQFQFLRFLSHPMVQAAARVVVECHAQAVSLLRANGFDAVPRGEGPRTDFHVPLLSLPHRLGTGSDLAADRVPYLRAPDEPAPALPARTAARLRLGLVWAGNPDFPGRITRDFDAALLPELLAIPDVQWVSLQQGADGRVALPGLETLPPLADWSATARTLAELDGLVTTDTGIAHLAGAMGVRTWVLLQKVPDWRWGLTGAGSEWYPSAVLVRQARPREWGEVAAALRKALQAYSGDARR